MRIISGSAKGRKLATFSGRQIRPTSDRVREAVFSLLFSRFGSFQGLAVLDLFAGTGAMALEALSRGAARAVLVEQGPQAAELIRRNLQACGLQERATLLRTGVFEALPRLDGAPFDLIFADPPYRRQLAADLLARLAALDLLAPGGLLCVETARDERLPAEAGDLLRQEERRYGSTLVHLYAHREPEE